MPAPASGFIAQGIRGFLSAADIPGRPYLILAVEQIGRSTEHSVGRLSAYRKRGVRITEKHRNMVCGIIGDGWKPTPDSTKGRCREPVSKAALIRTAVMFDAEAFL